LLLQVKFEQGIQILKIFKGHLSKTCILDDFGFYEARQRTIQERKVKQQDSQVQARYTLLFCFCLCFFFFDLYPFIFSKIKNKKVCSVISLIFLIIENFSCGYFPSQILLQLCV
jgi:hypothetical protein